jgi:hypothetical protein
MKLAEARGALSAVQAQLKQAQADVAAAQEAAKMSAERAELAMREAVTAAMTPPRPARPLVTPPASPAPPSVQMSPSTSAVLESGDVGELRAALQRERAARVTLQQQARLLCSILRASLTLHRCPGPAARCCAAARRRRHALAAQGASHAVPHAVCIASLVWLGGGGAGRHFPLRVHATWLRAAQPMERAAHGLAAGPRMKRASVKLT